MFWLLCFFNFNPFGHSVVWVSILMVYVLGLGVVRFGSVGSCEVICVLSVLAYGHGGILVRQRDVVVVYETNLRTTKQH
jgi:hypothetical protein